MSGRREWRILRGYWLNRRDECVAVFVVGAMGTADKSGTGNWTGMNMVSMVSTSTTSRHLEMEQ